MKDNIRVLPIWKKESTAEERLQELAMEAHQYPERYAKMMIFYQEVNEKDNTTVTRYNCYGLETIQALGLIELGKYKLLTYTHGGG